MLRQEGTLRGAVHAYTRSSDIVLESTVTYKKRGIFSMRMRNDKFEESDQSVPPVAAPTAERSVWTESAGVQRWSRRRVVDVVGYLGMKRH